MLTEYILVVFSWCLAAKVWADFPVGEVGIGPRCASAGMVIMSFVFLGLGHFLRGV